MAGFDNDVLNSRGDRLEVSNTQDIQIMQKGINTISRINYSGDPNGAVSANPASLSHDPITGDVWRKTSGTGNTGWQKMASNLEMPIGSFQYFSNANNTTYPNPYWLLCDGAILDQSDYPVLFDRVGLLNPGGQVWTLQDASTTSSFSAAIYSDQFVIGGNSGMIKTSTDGITWTAQTTGITQTVTSLCYSGSLYVLGASSAVLATSTDAITWTSRTSNTTSTINSIAFGGGMYVLVTSFGDVASSTDAITWTYRNGHPSPGDASIVYANGFFISFSLTSTDGISFYTPRPSLGSTNKPLKFLNGAFVGLGSGRGFKSTDGSNWKLVVTGTLSDINCLTYGDKYVFGAQGGLISTSTDAETWTPRTSGTATHITGVEFGNSVYVYVATTGASGTSTDAITWATGTTGTANVTKLTFGNGLFVLCRNTSEARSSTDGITWTVRPTGLTGNGACLVYQNSLYLMGTGSGQVGTSTDAVTWNVHATNTSVAITSLAFGNAMYVYATNSSFGYSTDLVTWTTASTPGFTAPSAITFESGLFYVSTSNALYTSTDGITWDKNDQRGNFSAAPGNGFNYLNNKYIYYSTRTIVTSTDAITWSLSNSFLTSPSLGPNCMTFGNGKYICSGFNQSQINGTGITGITYYIATSTDAITWDKFGQSATTSTMQAAAVSADTFLLVGNGGAVQTSPLDYLYDTVTQFQLPTQANNDGQLIQDFNTNLPRNLYIKAL